MEMARRHPDQDTVDIRHQVLVCYRRHHIEGNNEDEEEMDLPHPGQDTLDIPARYHPRYTGNKEGEVEKDLPHPDQGTVDIRHPVLVCHRRRRMDHIEVGEVGKDLLHQDQGMADIRHPVLVCCHHHIEGNKVGVVETDLLLLD
jgi:hypothetical protein